MAQATFFISAVSAEFGDYRKPFYDYVKGADVHIAIQEDFKDTGADTLGKLDEYIKSCTAVVHLIGDASGYPAEEYSVSELQIKYQDMKKRFRFMAETFEQGEQFSYTQWEAYLALYHRKPLFIAAPKEGAARVEGFVLDDLEMQRQNLHSERLKKLGKYPGTWFVSAVDLAGQLTSGLNKLMYHQKNSDRTVNAFLAMEGAILIALLWLVLGNTERDKMQFGGVLLSIMFVGIMILIVKLKGPQSAKLQWL